MIVLPSEFEVLFNLKSICLCVIFSAILYTLHLISHIFFSVEPSDLTTVLKMSIKSCAPASATLPIS